MTTPMLRSETSFQNPEDYKSYVLGEATKRASYLASMDQFYANLEEATRQFNETLSYKQDVLSAEKGMFSEELAFNKWLAEENLALEEKKIASENFYQQQKIDLAERQLDIQEEQMDYELAEPTYAESGFYQSEASKAQDIHDLTMGIGESILQKLTGGTPTTGPQSGAVSTTKHSPLQARAYESGENFYDYVDTNYGVA